MFTINCQENQYVVSLDSLDLTFLGQYVEETTDYKRPLWSKPDLEGELVLCEVELLSDDDYSDISYIESTETIICHICNVDVPQLYFKEHSNSTMHKNYVRLTEKILENVSKQITIDIGINDADQHDKFYCATCSKLVLAANKRKHVRSNYHLKCKENEKQIDEFLKLYTKSQQFVPETDIFDNKCNIENSDVMIIKNNIDSEYDTASDTDMSDNNSEQIDRKEIKALLNNKNSTETLDNQNQNSVKENKVESLEFNLEDFVDIKTPKGYKEKVKMSNFHGYVEYSNLLFCQLCDKWVVTNVQEHNINEDHLKNLRQPINDDFYRALVNKEICHCVLCNVLVKTNSNHASVNPNHKKYTSSELKNKTDTKLLPDKTFCDACNKYIDSHNYLGHIKGKNHIQKMKTKDNINKVDENNLTVNTATTSENKIQPKETYCHYCKVNVPVANMDIHEVEMAHIENKFKAIAERFIEQAGDLTVDKSKEASPSKAIATSAVQKNTDVVMTNEEKYEYNIHMTELSVTQVQCLVCDLKVPNLSRNIIEHIRGRNHTNNVINMLGENKITKLNYQLYVCNLCNTKISDFLKHINEDVVHIKNKLKNGLINKIKLREYVYDDPSNNSALATVYRDMYRDCLKQNNIIEIDKASLYCCVCTLKLTRKSEIDHMFGERHKSVLKV